MKLITKANSKRLEDIENSFNKAVESDIFSTFIADSRKYNRGEGKTSLINKLGFEYQALGHKVILVTTLNYFPEGGFNADEVMNLRLLGIGDLLGKNLLEGEKKVVFLLDEFNYRDITDEKRKVFFKLAYSIKDSVVIGFANKEI